jgi:hypothetical protein
MATRPNSPSRQLSQRGRALYFDAAYSFASLQEIVQIKTLVKQNLQNS